MARFIKIPQVNEGKIVYSDDILWEAKKELEKIAEDGLNQYN